MPRQRGCSKEAISANIAELIRSGRKKDQAVAIAHDWARKDCGKMRGKLDKK